MRRSPQLFTPTPIMWFACALALLACNAPQQVASEAQSGAPAARTVDQERPGRTLVDAKSLTLDELVEKADRIFRGRVRTVDEKTVSLGTGPDKGEELIREVTIVVEDGIKNVQTGQEITVRQLASVSAPLQAEDEVFWFLAKDSRLGLTQPLGVYSGDFRIQDTAAGKVVNNLRGNAGLWAGSLWAGDGFNRTDVLATASKDLALPQARVSTIDKAASVDPGNRNIPLDLLLAATKSRVKPQ